MKARPDALEDDKLSHIIEYLVRRGKQRPTTMKTLLSSTAALFNPKLDTVEVAALVEQLRVNGIFEVDGYKLQYGFPD